MYVTYIYKDFKPNVNYSPHFFKIVNGHCLDCIILSVSLRVKKEYANETLSYIFKKWTL